MSDHFSGPRALAGPQCDICGFFAFPSPQRPGNLVLIMDVVPRADPSSTFSEAIVHRFRLRTVDVRSGPSGRRFVPGPSEFTVDVTFATATGGLTQTGRVVAGSGEVVPLVVGDVEGGENGGIRAFAGLRSDPFFLDFEALQKTLASGHLAFRDPGVLTGPGADVLAIVVEIDRDVLRETGTGPLVAAVAETVTAGPLPIRLERVGRPEIKNLLLSIKGHDLVNRDIDLRDLYNLEDPFHVGPDYRGAYRTRLDANLAYLDTLDGAIGWPVGSDGAHPLTELLLDDFLVVDISRPHVAGSFLDIERSLLAGRPHRSCGGRSPADDAMDALYTLVFGGLDTPPISDHVDHPARPATAGFPYLAPPNRTAPPDRPLGSGSAGALEHQHHQFGHYQL